MVEQHVTADEMQLVNDTARSRDPDSSLGPRGEFVPLLNQDFNKEKETTLKPRKHRLKHGRSNSEQGPLDKEAQDEIHPLNGEKQIVAMISEKPPQDSSYNQTDESELHFSGIK